LAEDQDRGIFPEEPDRGKIGMAVGPRRSEPPDELAAQPFHFMSIFGYGYLRHGLLLLLAKEYKSIELGGKGCWVLVREQAAPRY